MDSTFFQKFNCHRRIGTGRRIGLFPRTQHDRSGVIDIPEVTLRYQIPIPPPRRSRSGSPPDAEIESEEELVWDYSVTRGVRSVSISVDADEV